MYRNIPQNVQDSVKWLYQKLCAYTHISGTSSTIITVYQNISEPSSTDTLPDLPNPDEENKTTHPELLGPANLDKGMGDLKLWSQLPEILKADMKEICKVEGNGYCLIESIIEALAQDYDIYYSKDQLIEYISKELCDKLDYTRYLRQPVTQEEVNFNLLNMTTSKTYSRVVTNMYLPAISSALDLHIKTIQNISGYYAIVNTLPIHTIDESSKKTITLIIQDGIYQAVVDIKGPTTPTSNSPRLSKFNPSPIFRVKPPSKSQVIIISDDSSENPSPVSSPTAVSSPIIIQPEEQREDPFLQMSKDADALIRKLKEEPEEEELVDISWQDVLVIRNGQRRTSFDMNPFKGMIPDIVDQIPYDINGTKYYIIDVLEDQQLFVKYRDGRYFEMNTSTRKGFMGVRRLGKCRGNFICRNP